MTNESDNTKAGPDRSASSGSMFIKLRNDGDSVVGAFVGEPVAYEIHWVRGRGFPCRGPGCRDCEAGNRPSLRIALNFFVPADGAMRVIEGGTMLFKSVLAAREKHGLDRSLFEVRRVGRAGDKYTTYTVLPQGSIDDALAATIAGARRHHLASLGRGRD